MWIVIALIAALGIAMSIPVTRYMALGLGEPWAKSRPLNYWVYEAKLGNPAAAEPLREIGEPAVTALRPLLNDEQVYVRRNATEMVGKMGSKARPVVPQLILTAISDDSLSTRKAAENALVEIGPAAITDLAKTLTGSLEEVQSTLKTDEDKLRCRQFAITTLDSICHNMFWNKQEKAPDESDSVPELIEALKHGDRPTRNCAARTLSTIGSGAKAAAPILLELLVEELKNVKPLVDNRSFRSEDLVPRYRLVDALGGIGPEAKAALPFLLDLIRNDVDDAGGFRSQVVSAIQRIDTDGKQMVAVLQSMLRAGASRQQSLAAHLFAYYAKYVPAAWHSLRESVPFLQAYLNDKDSDVRKDIAEALNAIDPISAKSRK